jgi:hypothetical protein
MDPSVVIRQASQDQSNMPSAATAAGPRLLAARGLFRPAAMSGTLARLAHLSRTATMRVTLFLRAGSSIMCSIFRRWACCLTLALGACSGRKTEAPPTSNDPVPTPQQSSMLAVPIDVDMYFGGAES